MFRSKKSRGEPDPEPTNPPTTAAQPASTPEDVKRALEEVLANQSHETQLAFWQQMMRLPQWHFAAEHEHAKQAIQQGTFPPIRTYRDGERRMVAVFSTSTLAARAADAKTGGAALAMPVRNAIGYVCSMLDEMHGVMVDCVPPEMSGFGTDLWALPGMFSHFNSLPPIEAIDAVARSIQLNQHPMEYMLAYRMVAATPRMLVAMQGDKPAVIQSGDELVLLGFTDQQHADQFAGQTEGASFIEAKPAEFATIIERIAEVSKGKVSGAIINVGPTGFGVNGQMFAKAVADG